MIMKPALTTNRATPVVQAPSARCTSGATLRTVDASAIGPGHAEHQDYSSRTEKQPVLREAVLEAKSGSARRALLEAIREEVPPQIPEVSRRSALLAVCGGATLWWLNKFPSESPNSRAIERIATSIPYSDAYERCADAAAVCSTLYSQMSSTVRMFNTGFLAVADFQDVCHRRLQSPYVSESLLALEEALPVIGMQLAYSTELKAGWARAQSQVDAHTREKWEMVTLSALQRTRRVQRLCTAMDSHKYTAAGVTLMVQDLRQLVDSLDNMLASAPSS